MAITIVTPEIISRLKNQLMISGLQQKDPPLFQVINQLIEIAQSNSSSINSGSNVGPAGISGKDGIPGFLLNDSFSGDDIIIPGPSGRDGTNGTNGTIGRDGAFLFAEDGIDGLDGMTIPIPGPKGDTGATGPPGSGAVSSVNVILTDAQFKTLNSVPVQVLAAQGVGVTIIPLFWTLGANITTGFNVNPTLDLKYTGGGGTNLTGQVVTSTGISRRLANCGWVPTNNVVDTGKTNTAVQVFANTDSTTGVTAGGFSFTMFYCLTTTP